MGASDWEDLMNGVFGPGGRLRAGAAKPAQSQKPAQDAQQTLQKNQQALSEALARQAEEISRLGGELEHTMQRDGLLTEAEAQAARRTVLTPAQADAFDGLEETLGKSVLGQPEFLKQLVRAFKRPFVLGTAGETARGVLLLHGPAGTGKHTALEAIAREMADRKLLSGPQIAWMDLGLYPGPGQEKLFLQDLYSALNGPGQILVFCHYERCHPGFLNMLAALAQTGKAPLNSRYAVQKGMLVDVGTALVPDAVSQLTPRGKYLVFLSEKGPEKLADRMGAGMVNALSDVCATRPFTEEELSAIAGRGLEQLTEHAARQLKLTVTADEDFKALARRQASPGRGAEPIGEFYDRCFQALAEYKLEKEPAVGAAAALTAPESRALVVVDGGQPEDLLGLLRQEYTGMLDEVDRELENIVGLAEVKDYVLRLKDSVQANQRRAQAGMKTGSVSMHMIFAGNPGTGKTTIARLVGKYLKAIGALRGGQLVEVSRADLVGRYVGHTAPLTNQVIRSALGGVLFIDEAYSLYRGKDDSFGLEAIDTLVKGMEDHRDDLVVILAGYSREMEQFLTANSGLASRFPNKIEFPDYTGEELWRILELNAKGRGYRLAEGCQAPLTECFTRAQAENADENGNGRMARNLLERAILNQSRRLAAEPEAALDELTLGDFALEEAE
ncbi:AAA family ATPase [Gemmiger sp. An194]|uniref:AAA family ATPase n=1 Tax=Gemmiger sp. An194 TaxID=1965582 RepID=UPI000B393D3F|nr:AAA family ATPase [Gemmiger sp. An194]OUP23867.1 stage V sporulation protein K [Gemmiger sp. An194]